MEKYGLRGGDIEVTVTNRSAMYPQVSLRTAKHIQTARNIQTGIDRMRQDSNSGLD
jgi:type II secretory pathway component PulC